MTQALISNSSNKLGNLKENYEQFRGKSRTSSWHKILKNKDFDREWGVNH